MTATPAEILALTEMVRIQANARGTHPALAEVRRQTALHIDAVCADLRTRGIDADAVLDQIDENMATYGQGD